MTTQDSSIIETLCVAHGGRASRHRLVYSSSAEDSVEEVVLHI